MAEADAVLAKRPGKLHWLRVASVDKRIWHGLHDKRGLAAMEAYGVLPHRVGVLVHDHWAPYWKLDGAIRALCDSHLLRELLNVSETIGQGWA